MVVACPSGFNFKTEEAPKISLGFSDFANSEGFPEYSIGTEHPQSCSSTDACRGHNGPSFNRKDVYLEFTKALFVVKASAPITIVDTTEMTIVETFISIACNACGEIVTTKTLYSFYSIIVFCFLSQQVTCPSDRKFFSCSTHST